VLNEDAVFDGYETRELREKKKDAELGYLSMPLFEPLKGAHWGQFNDRPVDQKAVKTLLASFNGNLENCTDNTAIEVIVRKGWLEEGVTFHETVEGLSIDQVSKLRLSEEGINAVGDKNLWVLGGNHRREAVQSYVTTKKKERKGIEKKLEAATSKRKKRRGDTEIEDAETQEEEEKMRQMMTRLDGDIAKASEWVVRVYDQGE